MIAQGNALSGTWSESSRGVNGTLEGRGGNGNFQVVASAPGFTANLSLATRGNKQSVVITNPQSSTYARIRSASSLRIAK